MSDSCDIVTEFHPPSLYGPTSLPTIAKEFKLFTVAPLYVYLDIPFDIVQQFRAEVVNCEHVQVTTPHPILSGVTNQYSSFLEGIPPSATNDFFSYMQGLTFKNGDRNLYSEVTWESVPLEGLINLATDALPSLQMYTVFLPTTNLSKFMLRTNGSMSGIIKGPPDKAIVETANKLLFGATQ